METQYTKVAGHSGGASGVSFCCNMRILQENSEYCV